jgi:hypothetical protein
MVRNEAPLVVEGLELRRAGRRDFQMINDAPACVISANAPMLAANCRFLVDASASCVLARGPLTVVRNCQFTKRSPSYYNSVRCECPMEGPSRVVIENCIFGGGVDSLGILTSADRRGQLSVELTQSTLVNNESIRMQFFGSPHEIRQMLQQPSMAMKVRAANNIFAFRTAAITAGIGPVAAHREPSFDGDQAASLLRRIVSWEDRENLFANEGMLIRWVVGTTRVSPARQIIDVNDWADFWDAGDTGSRRDAVKFVGGNLAARAAVAPEKIVPADFHPHARRGAIFLPDADDQGPGADIEAVGPGPAYERWKLSPEYAGWLKGAEDALHASSVPPDRQQQKMGKRSEPLINSPRKP